jgi:hypothetical protein
VIYKNNEVGEVIYDNAKNPNFKVTKRTEAFQWNGLDFEKLPTFK